MHTKLPRGLILLAAMAVTANSHAGPFGFFKFTPIADTSGGLYQSLAVFPVLNNDGRVAFGARLAGGVEGVFTRLAGGGVNTLADTGVSEYGSFGLDLSINQFNVVLFPALKFSSSSTDTVFLRGQGNSAVKLIDDTGTFRSFCSSQLGNDGASVFSAQRASNNKHVILTAGSGSLTGPVKVLAEEGKNHWIRLDCSASINQPHTVAFVGRQDVGPLGVFSIQLDGTVTRHIGDDSQFAFFDDVTLNNSGAVAFVTTLAGGQRVVHRQQDPFLTVIATGSTVGTPVVGGLSMNDSGVVAFNASFGANGAAVFVGQGQGLSRVVGPGSVLFGRIALFAHAGRGAINNKGQLAVHVGFLGGAPQTIYRVDPMRFPADAFAQLEVLQLTAYSSEPSGASTTLPERSAAMRRAVLGFSARSLTPDAELTVRLGDKVVKTLARMPVGVRQDVRVPIDLAYRDAKPAGNQRALSFSVKGPAGASVQLSDIDLPGLLKDPVRSGRFASEWTALGGAGGFVGVVDATRLRVRIDPWTGAKSRTLQAGANRVPVAILSDGDFDATTDIDRATVNLNGVGVRRTRDAKGAESPACEARDVNADQRADLVCEFDFQAPANPKSIESLELEAQSPYGWGISASSDVAGLAGG